MSVPYDQLTTVVEAHASATVVSGDELGTAAWQLRSALFECPRVLFERRVHRKGCGDDGLSEHT
jgi:hypothetical protein